MKKILFGLIAALISLTTLAKLDCSSPRYAKNPTLKQYCLNLEKSSNASILSTQNNFNKDFSKYQLQLEAQVEGNQATGASPGVNSHQPAAPAQPAPAPNTAPTPSAEPVEQTAPSPSGKPRRYY